MTPRALSRLAVLALAAVGCSTLRGDTSAPALDDEFMAAMQELAAPDEHHAELMALAGTWDVDGKWWTGPGAPAQEFTADSEMRPILGGRFLLEEYHSEFMGEPFEGMLIQGYDKMAEEYVSVWIDTWGTHLNLSRGHMSADTLHLTTTYRDVMTPEGRPGRSKIQFMGPDRYIMSMYDTAPDGREFKVMEFTYVRRS